MSTFTARMKISSLALKAFITEINLSSHCRQLGVLGEYAVKLKLNYLAACH